MWKSEEEWIRRLKKPFKTKEELEQMHVAGEAFGQDLRHEAAELYNELSEVTIKINSVWDLVNTTEPYPAAVPVLLKHLTKNYHSKTIEGIVRALGTKEAKPLAGLPLIKFYHSVPKSIENLRWIIGNAYAAVALEKDLNEVISIVEDRSNAQSRQMFIWALSKFKSNKVDFILSEILKDKDESLVLEALKGIKRRRQTTSLAGVQALLVSKNKRLQKAAVSTLKTLVKT